MKRLAFILAALGATAAAQAGDLPSATVRLSTSAEHLSNGTPDWRENSAGLQLGFAPHQSIDLSAGDVSRFGLHDNQFGASFTTPLSDTLAASVDASASGTHRVLARHAVGGELQYEFAHAWLVHAGARSTSFDSASVRQGLVALEHYFSDYSVTLGWRPTHALGRSANGLEARASYYYGEHNAVTLIAAAGQEAASIPGGVALTDVRSVALAGRHWLDRHWAVTWSAGRTRQGDLYSRNGVSLGAQYAF